VESVFPRALEKLSNLKLYGGTKDPDEHVEHIDTVMDYHTARGAVKSKLFVLAFKGSAMTWLKNLPEGSIDSWRTLCEEFASHFTARKRKPDETMASLSAILQDKKETLRECVE
jgi:hypothetical protein